MAGDLPAAVCRRIKRIARQPGVRPRGLLRFGLRLRVRPAGVAGDGMVAIEQERAEDFLPGFTGSHPRAGGVVMIQTKVQMVDAGSRRQILLRRAVVEKLVAAQHHPRADLPRVAGMAPAAEIPIVRVEVIFAVEGSRARPGVNFDDLLNLRRGGVLEIFRARHGPVPQLIHINFFQQVG